MIIVGHRGAAGEAPENTLAGISHALRLGIRDFEIDIRQCADGAFAVLHDANLLRTTGEDIFLHEIGSEELTTYFAHFQKTTWPAVGEDQFGNCYIPSLAQVLTFAPPGTSFQLEIKSDEHSDTGNIIDEIGRQFAPGCEALRKLRIVFTSFDIELVTQLKQQHPHLAIGVISDEDPMEALEIASELDASHCCLKHSLLLEADLNLRTMIEATTLHVSLWTVNEAALLECYRTLAVNSIITDFPDLMIREVAASQVSALKESS